ncbi:MAG: hypothetical protein ABIO40_01330 [Devosia sp.]
MQFELNITTQVLVTAISAMIAAAALFLAWRQARERQLRKDDVLRWANETIRSLQTLYLVCFAGETMFDAKEAKQLLAQAAVDTSVLVEQGRLYFRNTPDPEYGKYRHPAYRGYRPRLLDPIVVAHQIAGQWDGAAEAERQRMVLVAEDCIKRFVSDAQLEVGRSKTVSADAGLKGEGEKLEALLAKITPERLATLDRAGRRSL